MVLKRWAHQVVIVHFGRIVLNFKCLSMSCVSTANLKSRQHFIHKCKPNPLIHTSATTASK